MIWLAVGLGLVGVLGTAFFSGVETGFYRAVRLRLLMDALGGDRVSRLLVFLVNHPALVVATALTGTNLSNYLISAATVITIETAHATNAHLTEVIATLALAPLLLIYTELLPKELFLQAPNRLLRRGGPLLAVAAVVFFPVAGLFWLLGRLMARLVGDTSEPIRLQLAQNELRRVLEEGYDAGILHPAQQGLARGIFAVARRPVTRFLVPLADVARVDENAGRDEALRVAEHARSGLIAIEAAAMPGKLIGYVRVIDLWLNETDALRPLRPLLDFPEDTAHLAALTRMESLGEGLAQVVDAGGRARGIVTLDRLREPLFA